MVNWKNVNLIFLRELRDQLRDRRTLFMIIVLPLLLYPGLSIGMVEMRLLSIEQPQSVVLLGEEFLVPEELPQLIEGERFSEELFSHPGDFTKLNVVTAASLRESQENSKRQKNNKARVRQAKEISFHLSRQDELLADLAAIDQNALDDPEIAAKRDELQTQMEYLDKEIVRLFAASKIQALVLIPKDFGQQVVSANQQLALRNTTAESVPRYARPKIVHNSADDKSQLAFNRVASALDRWEDLILGQRLQHAELPENLHRPVAAQSVDLALPEQQTSRLWSKLFPTLLVIMSLTGAFYPAIDLAAGEKERGTMETLLICPASRPEIVLGKFFTIMAFSITTVLLNLISMGMTGFYMISVMGGPGTTQTMVPALPSMTDIAWVVILLIPLAAMFSSVCLALATFARSTKEGQYYLTPLLMVTLGLTMFCSFSGYELTEHPTFSVMPVCGVALLLKGLLMSSMSSSPLYVYAVPVLVSTLFYSVLALYWAVEQFKSEEVLFREAERFDLKLWIRHLLRDKEPTPSFSEAMICFILIMLLQFVSMSVTGRSQSSPEWMIRVLLITQIAVIASPALFMGVMLTTSLKKTFRLRRPNWTMLGTAALLAAAMHPLSLEWSHRLAWFFPELPPAMAEPIKRLMTADIPWWYLLGAMAVAPAICEELAFRGFILSGLRRTGRTWMAIGLSSLAFGFMHMIPQQVFNATLLGLLLGMIAIRSNSLLPGVVFHLIYNALGVFHNRFNDVLQDTPFIRTVDDQTLYGWPTLLVASLVAIPLIWRLVQGTGPAKTIKEQAVSTPTPRTLASTGTP